MASNRLDVRFGEASHGSLPITFELDGNEAIVWTSDVPSDPITPLVFFARFLLSNELGSRHAQLYQEPDIFTLAATKTSESCVDIQISDSGRDFELSASGLSRLATASRIWRALRRGEATILKAIERGEWKWDFPTTQVRLLASEIQALRIRN